ncbi:MAG: ATP-binding cassette domain-containing protein [Verrucomicrobiota bacterium]|nr:ATP-binding cassette domain-containing protein [Verrucomicrobiota bacterium]
MSDVLFELLNVTQLTGGVVRLRNITTKIHPGVTAVLGPSGAGKTTLLNLLVGYEKPTSGEVRQNVSATHKLPYFWVPFDLGLWKQHKVIEHLTVLGVNEQKAGEWLKEFDLEEQAAQKASTLSQGQASRLAVARALASEAPLLIFDEPLVHVGPKRMPHYWTVITHYLKERKASLIFSTHDPIIAASFADHGLFLDEGTVQGSGAMDDVLMQVEGGGQNAP